MSQDKLTPPPDASLVVRLREKIQGLLGLYVTHPHIVTTDLLGLLNEAAEALVGHGERPVTPAGTADFETLEQRQLSSARSLADQRGKKIGKLSRKLAHPDPPALPAAPRGQWMPIESAPKDGRLVLLYPSRGWAEDVNCDCEVGYWDQFTSTWLAYGPTAEDYTGATHWMPLPAAPAPASPTECAKCGATLPTHARGCPTLWAEEER